MDLLALLLSPVSFESHGRSGSGAWEVREQGQSLRNREESGRFTIEIPVWFKSNIE